MTTDRGTGRRTVLALLLVMLALFGLAGSAAAAETRGGDTVIVAADEVIEDDLFLSGNRVEMHGTVRGDLFAAGNLVVVDGEVEGSLFVAGQTLEVNGLVGGSLYGGSYSLTVGPQAQVARNVYYGGFSLETEPGSTTGRGLYAGGYQLIHSGAVAGDLNFGGGALELNGRVAGDVHSEVSTAGQPGAPTYMPGFPGAVPPIPPGFRLGDQAEVGGRLDVVETQAPRGRTAGERAAAAAARFVADRAGEFIALLIVGALLLRLWPDLVEQARSLAASQPLPSAGRGCLTALAFTIGLPIAAGLLIALTILVAIVTLGQLSGHVAGLGSAGLAAAVAVFAFAAGLVAKAVVAVWGGRLLLARAAPTTLAGRWGSYWALGLGALGYEILRAIPLLGWLVWLAVTLVGLGAIYQAVRNRWWPRRPASLPAPNPPAAQPPAAKAPTAKKAPARKATSKKATAKKATAKKSASRKTAT